MPAENGKPKSPENDPEQLSRLLELELMQKRAAWKQASERHRTIKSASFFFLFVVIVAALVGFFLLFSRVSEQRGKERETPASDTGTM